MRIRADFDQPALVHTDKLDWAASPMAGVDRRMLDRVGDEVARATSIVRYAPGSHFSQHSHDGGEEFVVLEGVFQDEHGDYPAGTYVRNPIGTHHIPRSETGCTIFVKLWQFDPEDDDQFAIDLGACELSSDIETPDRRKVLLVDRSDEQVSLEQWQAGAVMGAGELDGAEILVLDGDLAIGDESYGRQDWLRFPVDSADSAKIGANGARLWIKRRHLRSIRIPGE
ncbi:MAG: cupin domain-containing protein [Erythrobacter sp.]